MTTYIVTFEINNTTQKDALKKKLKDYTSYCPINDNCWAIISEDEPVVIRDNLSRIIEISDRIFVIRSGTHSAWQNAYGEKNNAWLKDHL